MILGTFLIVSSLSALQAFGDDDGEEREHGGYSERNEGDGKADKCDQACKEREKKG